jgi:hypothetical protein
MGPSAAVKSMGEEEEPEEEEEEPEEPEEEPSSSWLPLLSSTLSCSLSRGGAA